MFLRYKDRWKDGKQHRYWSVVENTRVAGGRVVQRHVLYLGEINGTQELAWRRSIEVLEDGETRPRTLSLFPEDRCEGLLADASIVRVKLSELRLCRPRQWGACWLVLTLWRELQLDLSWSELLGVSRKGTRWAQVLFVLVAYRLLAAGSEWRLHREWFLRSALADLLGEDGGLAEIHKLYRCHDQLLIYKQAVFDHLAARWRDLFNVSYDVLLYDLTSTYFEAHPPFPEGDKRRFGYSRDHRPDCVQVVIARVVTPEGLPLAYEVLPGNTSDKTTLRGFLERIERQYGKARRVWLMDRGVPTEEVLAEMRAADPPVHYLVGTPKGRLTRLEKHLVDKPWQETRPGVQVKLLAQEDELYVFAQSLDRVAKERAIRPVFHQFEARVEAHIFIAFLAYCLHVTLARRLHALAPRLTPRSVFEKFAAVQMIDVHLPTIDGRELLLTRYTEPKLLLNKLKLDLPAQPPPKIGAAALVPPAPV